MLQTLSGWLLTPSALTPHGFCLLWEPWLIWSQVLGDAATGLAYFAIPLALVHFVRRRRDLAFKPVFWLFAVFILLCGTTHWMDLLTIWMPAYRLAAVLTLATAAVSIATAAVLWPLMPYLLALPSPAQMQAANEALQSSETGFRLLAEHACDMVSRVGPDGKRRYVSPAAERILGLPPAALVGRSLLEFLRPEDRPILEASMTRLLTGAAEQDGVTVRMFRSDGTEIWVEATARALRDPLTGAPDGYVSILRDVTEREAASAALRRLTGDLETRVREEAVAREAAQVRAAHGERMQALGQLAGGIAHDFNNVLQTVQGSATLIEEQPDDVEGVRDLARMILDAAGRGAAITARLLAFARRADLRAETVDARGLLERLRDILRHTLGAIIAVRVEPAAYGLPPLLADKGQLETAMVNLAANARDAMPGGGVLTLAATAEVVPDGEAHPAGLRPGRYLRLSVVDTGAGIDTATLARVTEPFFTTKPQGQGTVSWSRLFGQFGGVAKLGSDCRQAANFSIPVTP
jgi:PAS domain S-box-containing protein